MKTRMLFLGLVPFVALSCSSAAPVKVAAGDQCFRCRRTISDTQVAAEIVDRMVTKYRGAGCMAKYLATHPEETGTLYVTDFTTGKMIPPARAAFVPVLLDRATGEKDYRAYSAKADAAAAAHALQTDVVDWQTVLEQAR